VSVKDQFCLHWSVVVSYVAFVKDAIDENSHSKDDSLLISRTILGEINNKRIGVGENFLILYFLPTMAQVVVRRKEVYTSTELVST
jgi:hypothetical protein